LNLSETQLDVLRNLSRKKAGAAVGWIAIAEARGLTELGFAIRNASGWEITDSGELELARHEPRAGSGDNIIDFQFSTGSGR
jgi:hypothetical protein